MDAITALIVPCLILLLLWMQERKIRALRREVEERAYHIGRQAEVDRQTAAECATKEAKAAEDRILELLEGRVIETTSSVEMIVDPWFVHDCRPRVVNAILLSKTMNNLLRYLGLEETTQAQRTFLRKKAKAGGKG